VHKEGIYDGVKNVKMALLEISEVVVLKLGEIEKIKTLVTK